MIALIAEKPSVAKDIARIIGATQKNDGYLSGNGYMVTWAFGHLIQLAMPEAYGVANFRRESLPIQMCIRDRALHDNFSEKKALAFLYKLEKATTELAMLNRQVIDLTNECKELWLSLIHI